MRKKEGETDKNIDWTNNQEYNKRRIKLKVKLQKAAIFIIVLSLVFVFNTKGSNAGEGVVRTIQISYPSKSINGSTTVVAVPGCQYTFTVVGDLPAGTHIEWKDKETTKGSWSSSTLYPYETGGGGGSYSITAVLVGGEGEGPGWEVTVSGTITDPILSFSEPAEHKYFAKDQTSPTPQANLKVTVTKPGGTQLEGVNVKFVADKSDSSRVQIGSVSTNSSGEASKTWTVPVSAAETFTLKAGTGNDYNNLENEATCSYKVYVVKVKVTAINSTPFCPYPNSNQIADITLSVSPSEYNSYKEVRIMDGAALVKRYTPATNLVQWNGKDGSNNFVNFGEYSIECSISVDGTNTNDGPSSVIVEPDVETNAPDKQLITADNSKSSTFQAELHDESGIDIAAQHSVVFTITTNPRGSLVTPVNAENGVASSTFTPDTMIWSESNKPSGNVKSDLKASLPSNYDLSYTYVIPQPGLDVAQIDKDVNGLTVSVWADYRQEGPDLLIAGVTDLFKAGVGYGDDTYSVSIEWGDNSTPTTFIQSGGTGIGSKSHTYDGDYEGQQVTITMTVDGIVNRSYSYGNEQHDYSADEETINVQL